MDHPTHSLTAAQLFAALLITTATALVIGWTWRAYGLTLGVAFAFGINWILMAWAIGLGRALESKPGAWDGLLRWLPDAYYASRPFESGGRIYDCLGTRWYQRSRLWHWSLKPSRLRSESGSRKSLLVATRGPEAGHLVIFVVINVITLWALAGGWWITAAWLLLFNLLHNAYPVFSMRQIRARLDRSSCRHGA